MKVLDKMHFEIQGRLDGLNEYTNSCRSNRYGANAMKKRNQERVRIGLLKARSEETLQRVYKYPIQLKIAWYGPNMHRDVDNITFATKFILDEMVKQGIIQDDSQKYVSGVIHDVRVDKENPRIEVEIQEV